MASLSPSLHDCRRSDCIRTPTQSGRALLRASYEPLFTNTCTDTLPITVVSLRSSGSRRKVGVGSRLRNFRLLHRLFVQIGRILKINGLGVITYDMVEAVHSILVIGAT